MTSIVDTPVAVLVLLIGVIAALSVLLTRSTRLLTRSTRAERALRESEARFRLVAERAPVMIWTARPDTTLDFVNATCVEFTGMPHEQLLDEGWLNAVHPQDLDHTASICVPAIEARQPFVMEYRLRRADGAYRWVLDTGVPKLGADGNYAGYIGCSVDITERRKAKTGFVRVEPP